MGIAPEMNRNLNPIVFFDIQVGPERVGRMVIELRQDVVPRTAENFRKLCVGDQLSESSQRKLTYTGTRIHKVQRLFAVCGGTIGKIGESIYGATFPDENFELLVSGNSMRETRVHCLIFILFFFLAAHHWGSFNGQLRSKHEQQSILHYQWRLCTPRRHKCGMRIRCARTRNHFGNGKSDHRRWNTSSGYINRQFWGTTTR